MRARLTKAFIGVASIMIILATSIYIVEMHYHLAMFQQEFPMLGSREVNYSYHIEQALIQSTIWTALGTIVLAIIISSIIAKKITSPLIIMRTIAEKMAKGDWSSRIKVKGDDELANLGQSLNHLTEQLQKQETLRKNLTSDIAHELRTPLATLKSHMEAFKDGVWEPTPEKIDSCYEEIERLIHLVGDLEQLTNLESPDFILEQKKENLQTIIQQCVQMMQSSFLAKEVNLVVTVKDYIPVFVDKNRVIQIVMNILSNSLNHTHANGKVYIQVKEESDFVSLLIKDTGIGIPSSELTKVFERFYRVDKSRSRESGGSGIGLTIVKKLVEAHDGSIKIHSELGKGTTVYISFPKVLG